MTFELFAMGLFLRGIVPKSCRPRWALVFRCSASAFVYFFALSFCFSNVLGESSYLRSQPLKFIAQAELATPIPCSEFGIAI
jgi:hypothetical protein